LLQAGCLLPKLKAGSFCFHSTCATAQALPRHPDADPHRACCPRRTLAGSIPDSDESLLGRVVDEMKGSRSVGVRRVEYMLPVGTPLTAVGELRAAVEHPSAFQVRCAGRPRAGPSPASACGRPVSCLASSQRACWGPCLR
jgi:hypothetical protein